MYTMITRLTSIAKYSSSITKYIRSIPVIMHIKLVKTWSRPYLDVVEYWVLDHPQSSSIVILYVLNSSSFPGKFKFAGVDHTRIENTHRLHLYHYSLNMYNVDDYLLVS